MFKRLDELARIETSRRVTATLKPAVFAVEEAAHALRHYLGKLEADPARLDEVEIALAALEKLKRKYGATIDEVLVFLEDVARAIERRGNFERAAATRFAKEVAELATSYEQPPRSSRQRERRRPNGSQQTSKPSWRRWRWNGRASKFALRPRRGPNHGADAVEFLMSANAGEEPKPLDKIASGGEISRVALALKTCTSPARA